MGPARGYDKMTGSKSCKRREDWGLQEEEAGHAAFGSEPQATHLSHSGGVGCLAKAPHLGNIKEVETGIANQIPGKCLYLH